MSERGKVKAMRKTMRHFVAIGGGDLGVWKLRYRVVALLPSRRTVHLAAVAETMPTRFGASLPLDPYPIIGLFERTLAYDSGSWHDERMVDAFMDSPAGWLALVPLERYHMDGAWARLEAVSWAVAPPGPAPRGAIVRANPGSVRELSGGTRCPECGQAVCGPTCPGLA